MSETEAQTTKKRTKKDDYIVQGSILAAAAVLTKIIGVVYRIPLTNILGDEGNGFYGYAYQVYAIALMISSFSLPTAVSKLVSIRLAKRQRRNAFRVFICSLAFVPIPKRTLAPTILITALNTCSMICEIAVGSIVPIPWKYPRITAITATIRSPGARTRNA